jgi:hypothetical protein
MGLAAHKPQAHKFETHVFDDRANDLGKPAINR